MAVWGWGNAGRCPQIHRAGAPSGFRRVLCGLDGGIARSVVALEATRAVEDGERAARIFVHSSVSAMLDLPSRSLPRSVTRKVSPGATLRPLAVTAMCRKNTMPGTISTGL